MAAPLHRSAGGDPGREETHSGLSTEAGRAETTGPRSAGRDLRGA